MINSIVTTPMSILMEKMNDLSDLLVDLKINHKHILYIHVIRVDKRDSSKTKKEKSLSFSVIVLLESE